MQGAFIMIIRETRKIVCLALVWMMVFPAVYPTLFAEAQDTSNLIAGCAAPITSTDYSGGFVEADFDISGVLTDENGDFFLDTGIGAIDPNNIVIPVEQQLAVTFLYEGTGLDDRARFGWMYANDVLSDGSPDINKVNWIYENISDNNKDAVLDIYADDDFNGDGVVNVKDNRRILSDSDGNPITFPAGIEIVFVHDSKSHRDCSNSSEWCGGVFYTKSAWNEPQNKCTNNSSRNNGPDGDIRIIELYSQNQEGVDQCYTYYEDCYANNAECHTQGFMDQDVRNTLRDVYGYNFRAPTSADPEGFNEIVVDQPTGEPAIHTVVAVPDETPNAWVLGFDDTKMDGNSKNDFDYNDIVFLVERQTGGTAELKSENMMTPSDANAFYTEIELDVWDIMPCSGGSEIKYFVSIDYEKNTNGDYVLDEDHNKIPDWQEVETTQWTEVYSLSVDYKNDGSINSVTEASTNIVDQWAPGSHQSTHRKAVIDLISQNKVGRDLLWKAEFKSDNETCVPKILDVELNGTVARHAVFSRSAPIIQTNIVYSGSYETPNPTDTAWMQEPMLRGHLKAIQIYDPTNPTATSGNSANAVQWDAGQVLADRTTDRTIYFPQMDVTTHTEEIGEGDAETRTFTGTLLNAPVLDGTFYVQGRTSELVEFRDLYSNDMLKTQTVGASGWINRFSGEYSITFPLTDQAPDEGEVIVASYSSYSITTGAPDDFTVNNTALDNELLNIQSGDGIERNDLINWVHGADRPWPLGAIDHSAPAVMTPPGLPAWYFGSAVPDSIKNAYYAEGNSPSGFKVDQEDRQTVVFVGSRDGMLHAFDGGTFDWGDNSKTASIKEHRGHFVWSGDTKDTADYGTGEELWAYIPGNLVPKIKNNYSDSQETFQASVDASPALSDVYIPGVGFGAGWRTVLLFAEGDGGHTVTCMDVTDPSNPMVMWEYGDKGLFNSKSSPAIGMIKDSFGDGKWVAFFNSGRVHSLDHPNIYIVDIETGTLLNDATIVLDSGGNSGLGGVGSGQPAIIDSDKDGFIDSLYVGTDKGFMYKIDISDMTDITDTVINPNERTAERGVYGSPTVVVGEAEGDSDNPVYPVHIFFGTGGTDDDTTYKFYAYTDVGGTTSLEWSYELPAGHRVFTSAFAAAGQIYFTTTSAITENPCEAGGQTEGNVYAFKYKLEEGQNEATPVLTESLPPGSGRVHPVVDDEHLYLKTTTGALKSMGSGEYNNAAVAPPGQVTPQAMLQSWREVY